MSKHLLAVKHNIEVAHRLYQFHGKCEAIHGHSMWITLWVEGELDKNGILDGIDFGVLKKDFRGHLDDFYDHQLLLNVEDPFAQTLYLPMPGDDKLKQLGPGVSLPGLQVCPGDPTTENIAKWIAEWGVDTGYSVHAVDVEETAVNMARYKVT